tara:strand:- start:920 stop:1117 length:198 start_codon:yes stop_codon:yes gene_type:complete
LVKPTFNIFKFYRQLSGSAWLTRYAIRILTTTMPIPESQIEGWESAQATTLDGRLEQNLSAFEFK